MKKARIEKIAQEIAQEIAQDNAQEIAQEIAQDNAQEIAQEIAQDNAQELANTIENALIKAKASGEIPLEWTKKARLEIAKAAAGAADIFHSADFLKKTPSTVYSYIARDNETGDIEIKKAKYAYNLTDFARFSVLVPYIDGLRLSEAQYEQAQGANVACVSVDVSRLMSIKEHVFEISNNTACEWLQNVLAITAGAKPQEDARPAYNAAFNHTPRKSWARYLRRGMITARNGHLYLASREVTARLVVDLMTYARNGGEPEIKER